MLALIATLTLGQAAASELAPTMPAPLEKLAKAMQQVRTLQASMRQEKEMAVFGETIVSRGRLAFVRPRMLWMDIDNPGGSTLIVNGDQMVMHYKGLGTTERFDLRRDPRAKAVAEHLFLLLEADLGELGRIYTLTVQQEKPLRFSLTPRAEALARIISRIDARTNGRGLVSRLDLIESGGDVTRWSFDEQVVNAEIDSSRFQVP